MSEERIEEAWVAVLADVVRQAKLWRVRRKSWLDVFEHRLEFAKYEPDVKAALQRLCNALSIQGLRTDYSLVDYLYANNDLAMRVLRKWTKVLAGKAFKRAFERAEA